MAIEFIPVQDAPDSLIHECVASVLDSLSEGSRVAERMWARVQAVREGEYPAACDLLLKDWHGVGWSGWFPLWTNPYAAWSSATYLAPSLRGKGLLPILRCRQIHAAQQICEELDEDVEFVSSIETANTRSLKASFRYAKNNGWANRWYLYEDKDLARLMLRMEWPEPHKAKHVCYLGRDLKQFTETLTAPEVEINDPDHHDLTLVVDTWVRQKAQQTVHEFEAAPEYPDRIHLEES